MMRALHLYWPHPNREQLLITLDVVKFLMLLILAVAFVNFNAKLSEQVAATKVIASNGQAELGQIKSLGQQNYNLSQQNKQLYQQNQEYQKCNFLAFAKFTRTGTPIQDSEINTCDLSAQNTSALGGGTGFTKSIQPVATPAPIAEPIPTPAPSDNSSSNNGGNDNPTPMPKPRALLCQLTL